VEERKALKRDALILSGATVKNKKTKKQMEGERENVDRYMFCLFLSEVSFFLAFFLL
jgi:hypothetical protein